MKLSFSTNRWEGYSLDQFIGIANTYAFDGIEIHSIQECADTNPSTVYHRFMQHSLQVPCIDLVADIGSEPDAAETELAECLDWAKKLRAPYIRLKCMPGHGALENAGAFVSKALPLAKEQGIVLLVETVGEFANTEHLRDFLDTFASAYVCALWDLHYPSAVCHESPEETIRNLGAYVKHVHIKDSEGENAYALVGEGSLPIDGIMDALRSVNYGGFISIEWDPAWDTELCDIDVIFTHFVNFMSRFDTSRNKKPLFTSSNCQNGYGKYIWPKQLIIEKTFSQVLDAMAEQFPDQYAFKYTSLDYTRTYAQFRDDVDRFARALIAMGVRKGSHVAIWATNVPQWFITFWATTKIGAVLVSVNTAYKIYEAEYLFRQSDTHTLVMVEGFKDSNYKKIMQELCPELANTRTGTSLHSRRLPFLRNIVTVGFSMEGCMTWEQALDRSAEVPQEEVLRMAANVDVHDVCNMQYTSGTTGFPKGVMLTHYNVVNDGKCIGDRMDLSTADRMMIQVPMFHCFGMVLAMTASMTHGVTLSPIPYFSPKSSLACINQERITCFHGVPTMFIAMLEHPDFAKTDFSHIRTGIMAGSPCPVSVMQDVIDKMNMREITIVYGQTESSPGCTMSSTDDPIEVRVNTVGRAFPEVECKIVDPETGLDCPDNVIGEFVARGYNVMKGYYKMP
ncbi:MAG: AMP-binding protein, partial [Clostridia bacterium]|nr:AMP-binding protein [Clostridia bacterium]